jgi:hypothetical protein
MCLVTGLPVWPYLAPSLLLRAINAPAFVVATPYFLLPHLQTDNARYPMLLAMIVLWWWWLGTRVDFGLLACWHYRSSKLQAVVLASKQLHYCMSDRGSLAMKSTDALPTGQYIFSCWPLRSHRPFGRSRWPLDACWPRYGYFSGDSRVWQSLNVDGQSSPTVSLSFCWSL